MMSMSDSDLLQCYVHEGSQAAFAELVARHLDLVYSVARRHVPSAAAEDVAQSVFVELAHHGRNIKPGTPLVAWLHVVARRAALNASRNEIRRRAREHAAAEIAAMKPSPTDWKSVEPLLDEAVESLNPLERSAILLRYFENRSLREVGSALGTSDDAAQKRVARAVEQLRAFFLRRGLALTAAGLVTDLSAHALHTAPASLGAAISTSAALFDAAGSTAALEATKAITMTTVQKSFIAATFALTVGAGLYEARVWANLDNDLTHLRETNARLATELGHTREQRRIAARDLKLVESEIDARLATATISASPADLALETQARTWLANLDRLKQLVEQRPILRLPESSLLPDDAWIDAARSANFDSDEGLRRAVSNLRRRSDTAIATRLMPALRAYLQEHNDVLPDRVDQLLPWVNPPLDPALISRVAMIHTGKLSDVPTTERSNLVATKEPVDVEYDHVWRIGTTSIGFTLAMTQNVNQAQAAFARANGGRRATIAGELQPYLIWPAPEAALQKAMAASAPRGLR
jgi:RNA polymerase sigma factor (sigma-70 family)